MAEEKKEEPKKEEPKVEVPQTPAQAPVPAPAPEAKPAAEVKAEAKPAAEVKPAAAVAEKAPAEVKKEKPANCASCNKSIKNKRWYYRSGKFYCTKRCWKTAAKKEEKPAEAAGQEKK